MFRCRLSRRRGFRSRCCSLLFRYRRLWLCRRRRRSRSKHGLARRFRLGSRTRRSERRCRLSVEAEVVSHLVSAVYESEDLGNDCLRVLVQLDHHQLARVFGSAVRRALDAEESFALFQVPLEGLQLVGLQIQIYCSLDRLAFCFQVLFERKLPEQARSSIHQQFL